MKSRDSRVEKAGRQAGILVLCEPTTARWQGNKWSFLSARTGKTVLVWFQATGHWLDVKGGMKGTARSPFGALNMAIGLDRKENANA